MNAERLLEALRHGATIDYVSETHVWYMNGNRMTREDIEALQQINDRIKWAIDWGEYNRHFINEYPIFNAILQEDTPNV